MRLFIHIKDTDTVWATQQNRKLVREATNLFWLGQPSEHKDLAALLESLGLPADKPVLNKGHPVVAAFEAKFPGRPFVLAPAKTSEKCSLKAAKDPIFEQFLAMHGKSFVARMPMRDLANLLLRI